MTSFQDYASVPSAVISDGVLTVPIWAVTTMTLSETYQLPPIGSTSVKASVAVHDDTISLSGVLVGPERFVWKQELETLAEVSKRGGAIAAASGGRIQGLVLVTSMTIRTDMQVQSLSFTASSTKREAIDVTVSLAYTPLPGPLGKVLDVASLGVGSLSDLAGR
jgi:hypothetical protein